MNRYYQQGGQEGSQDQMQMIMQKVAQMLQQGVKPEQVLGQLVNAGIPEDQAIQLVQGVMQQMGGAEQPNAEYGYGGMRTYQTGAIQPEAQQQPQQQNQMDEVMQILQAFAQMQGLNQQQFEQLVQKFMQLSPEEQKEALTQIVGALQQEQQESPEQEQQEMPSPDQEQQEQAQMQQQQMAQEQMQQNIMEGGGRFMTPGEMTRSMSLFNSPANTMAQVAQERGANNMYSVNVTGNPFSQNNLRKYQVAGQILDDNEINPKYLKEDVALETPVPQKSNDVTPVGNMMFNLNDYGKLSGNINKIKSLQQDLAELGNLDESIKNSKEYQKFIKSSQKKDSDFDGIWGQNTQALYKLIQSKISSPDSNLSRYADNFKSIRKEANSTLKNLKRITKPKETSLPADDQTNANNENLSNESPVDSTIVKTPKNTNQNSTATPTDNNPVYFYNLNGDKFLLSGNSANKLKVAATMSSTNSATPDQWKDIPIYKAKLKKEMKDGDGYAGANYYGDYDGKETFMTRNDDGSYSQLNVDISKTLPTEKTQFIKLKVGNKNIFFNPNKSKKIGEEIRNNKKISLYEVTDFNTGEKIKIYRDDQTGNIYK